MSLRLRPVPVSWQGISTILYSTLSQLSSSIIGTIELVLLLPSTESETALQLHKDGPNLPAQLRKFIADPRFDMLENVRVTLQQHPGAPSLVGQDPSGAADSEVERHMRDMLAPWEARGILSVKYEGEGL